MQVIGSIMGCVIAPLTFLMFYKAFPLGVPGTAYPAPYATIYRAMAILGVEVGLSYPNNSSYFSMRCTDIAAEGVA